MVDGGISADYFLDQMQPYELEAIITGIEDKAKIDWEQVRFLSYITAQCQSTKKLKPTDIITFAWDQKEKEEADWEGLRKMREEINKLNETE